MSALLVALASRIVATCEITMLTLARDPLVTSLVLALLVRVPHVVDDVRALASRARARGRAPRA